MSVVIVIVVYTGIDIVLVVVSNSRGCWTQFPNQGSQVVEVSIMVTWIVHECLVKVRLDVIELMNVSVTVQRVVVAFSIVLQTPGFALGYAV